MGFGHFNYIWQFARYHAESLSITFILFSICYAINIKNGYKLSNTQSLIIGLVLSSAVFLRPNFLPTSLLLVFYFMFFLNKNRHFFQLFLMSLGFSFILFSLLHNLYFGNAWEVFTKSNAHFVYTNLFQIYNDSGSNLIINQFLKWNPLYNMHRLFILKLIK